MVCVEWGVEAPFYSATEVSSSGSCKGTQPLTWLKLHAKGQLEGLQSGAGRPRILRYSILQRRLKQPPIGFGPNGEKVGPAGLT